MMKKEIILEYTVFFQKVPEGGYIASVPMLPGCMSQGETFEEVQEYIADAIEGYISVLKEDNEEIPIESKEHIAAIVAVPLPA